MKLFKKPEIPLTPIGQIKDVKIEGNLLCLECRNADVTVTAISPEIVRIRAAKGGRFEPDNSYAVIESDRPETSWEADWDGSDVIFTTSSVNLRFNKSAFDARFSDAQGVPCVTSARGESMGFRGDMPGCSFDAPPEEMYLGLGEKTGGLNKRGKRWTMWNTDRPYLPWHDPLYQSIPFVIGMNGSRCWGIFFDNTFRSTFDMGKADKGKWSWMAHGGEINAYYIAGPALRDVTRRFFKLVGGVPMPPRWILGYHQSRYSYKTDAEVRRIAKNLRDLQIPCDVIHLDIHYMRDYRDFTFDPKRFPNPKQLASDLKRDGFRIITIVDPGVKEDNDWEVWRDGVSANMFCKYDKGGIVIKYCWPKRAGWPDFDRRDVRDWWGEQHRFYVDNGIAGVWNDMNEPSMWNGAFYLADSVIPTGFYDGKGMMHSHFGELQPHERCRNVFGMLENRASREGLLKHRPDERPAIITRSGYAGVGRYAIMWTGDNFSTWAHLRMSVPMQLNLGLCAEPIAGPDIGGFAMSSKPELYARWIQLGAFYPFCRTHTAIYTRRQEPYSFGKRVEEIARRYIGLRYTLLPFIYSLVYNAHLFGDPIWRPMSYEFPDDREAAKLDDQFMMGSHLLIAPVMRRRATERSLYLPEGRWTDFFTGEVKRGPAKIAVFAPLEHLPIFVREGAVIPMGPLMQYTDERKTDPLTIHVYPGTGSGDLYEDDGISMQYEKGAFARTAISVEENGDSLKVVIGERSGNYEIAPREVRVKLATNNEPRAISHDGKMLGRNLWKFEKGAVSLAFPEHGGEKVVLDIFK